MRGSRYACAVLALTVATPAVLAAAGCQGANCERPLVPARDLWDPSPDRRTRSVREVLRRGDRRQLETLVRLLDDPDPGVRLMASGSLEELTGRESAYRAYMDAAERRPHVEAWRAWVRGGGAPATFEPVPEPAAAPGVDPEPESETEPVSEPAPDGEAPAAVEPPPDDLPPLPEPEPEPDDGDGP